MLEESMSTSTVPSSIWASIFSWFTPSVFFVFVVLTIGTIFFTSTLANSSKPEKQQEGEETNPKLARSPSVLQRLKSINLYSYRSPEPVSATSYEKVPDLDDDSHHLQFSFQPQLQQTPEQDQRQQQPLLDRSPSVLQRFRAINLYNYLSPEPSTPQKSREIYTHYTPKQMSQEEEEREEEQEPEQQQQEEEDYKGGLEQEEEIVKGEEPSLDEVDSNLNDSHVSRTKSDTKAASGEVLPKLHRKIRKSAFSHFEEEDIVESRRPATEREGEAKAPEEDDEVDAKADDFIKKFKQQLKLQRI